MPDARHMVLALPERDQRQDKWRKLVGLLLNAAPADNASLTAFIEDRIEEALRRPPITTVRLAGR